jgi:carnitine O-acetyltransferase
VNASSPGKSPLLNNGNNLKVYPRRIEFKLNSEIEEDIAKAYFHLKDLILSNDSATLTFSRYGGQFMKDNNFSPDAFVQIAIQLAYFKLFGRCDAYVTLFLCF